MTGEFVKCLASGRRFRLERRAGRTAADPAKIAGFVKRNGIDCVVGQKSHFAPGARQWARSDFALSRIGQRSEGYADGRFFVISSTALEKAARESVRR